MPLACFRGSIVLAGNSRRDVGIKSGFGSDGDAEGGNTAAAKTRIACDLFPERRHARSPRRYAFLNSRAAIFADPSRARPGYLTYLAREISLRRVISTGRAIQRGDAERRGAMAAGWFTGSVRLSKPTYRSHLNPAVQEARTTTTSARSLAARWNSGYHCRWRCVSRGIRGAREIKNALSVSVEERDREWEREKDRDGEKQGRGEANRENRPSRFTVRN